jgi:hypothetical protein
LKSQYIFSILLFVSKNRNLFTTNFGRHNIWTRQSDNLHFPSSSLTIYQNGAYFTGIKIFNRLPLELKQLVGFPRKCKGALRGYLVSHCFYSLEKFFSMNWYHADFVYILNVLFFICMYSKY